MKVLMFAALLLALGRYARAADLHGVTGFDEFAEGHDNIGRALTRRPSLVQDPNYLKHHPSLAHFLHDNPLARAELEAEAGDEAVPPPSPAHVREQPDGRRRRPPSALPRMAPKPDDDDD